MHTAIKHLLPWGLHHFPGQHVPMLDHNLHKEKLSSHHSAFPHFLTITDSKLITDQLRQKLNLEKIQDQASFSASRVGRNLKLRLAGTSFTFQEERGHFRSLLHQLNSVILVTEDCRLSEMGQTWPMLMFSAAMEKQHSVNNDSKSAKRKPLCLKRKSSRVIKEEFTLCWIKLDSEGRTKKRHHHIKHVHLFFLK